MIIHTTGNILNDNSEALVNPVNCVGVMGRGLALQFKEKWPENFNYYKKACDDNKVAIGKMLVFNTNQLFNPKYIINFPTKNHWRYQSQISYIDSGLLNLVCVIKELNINSIAIPQLGCGLGGLNWEIVREMIELTTAELMNVDVKIYIN